MPEWSIVPDNTYTQTLRPNNRLDRKKKWSTNLMEILKKKRFLPMWNKIFLLVCVIAITLDPLFFYIPMIDEDKKCIKMDKKLKLSAVILRSLMDTVYIIDIICNAAKVFRVAQRFSYWSLIFVDILAILPVPQVIILVLHQGLEASGSSSKKWLNAILLSQYIPRIIRIYLSCMELTWTRDKVTRIVWVKGGLNFFLYILASHVFGSFWYFYSFLRETSCWQRACGDNMEELCDQSGSHICDKISESRNITHLNLYCPINPPNATMFDFGIFLGALQSGVLGSNDFRTRRCLILGYFLEPFSLVCWDQMIFLRSSSIVFGGDYEI
ncbi:Ion transport domain containing protein [Trema orientale]|uniref:Ion transport domain containing protein n=1 Tax=Trema orientale TaxID=63057 RepID=A0A2P5FGE2_TREOI|nr:Ion transport domain containing protein [Trema orientale]